MILEHDMTKKKLRLVAFDHFLANNVVNTRREIFHEREKDLERKMQSFSAIKIQTSWRARKQLSKTKFQLKLNQK